MHACIRTIRTIRTYVRTNTQRHILINMHTYLYNLVYDIIKYIYIHIHDAQTKDNGPAVAGMCQALYTVGCCVAGHTRRLFQSSRPLAAWISDCCDWGQQSHRSSKSWLPDTTQFNEDSQE